MELEQGHDKITGPQAIDQESRRKRPLSVTVLMSGVLLFTAFNLIRFILSISYFGFLSSRLAISPMYLVLTGFVWGLVGLVLFWGLWTIRSWAPSLMQAIALTYALYFWLDRIFLSEHPVSGAPPALSALLPGNWVFSAAVTVITLGFIAWIMNRSKVKLYFRISNGSVNPPRGEDMSNLDDGTPEK